MNVGFHWSQVRHTVGFCFSNLCSPPIYRFVDMSDNMSWRCMDISDDGNITSEGQGSPSPYMLLIMQQMANLMKQRQEEDAAKEAQEHEAMDKSKDVASYSKQFEDDLKDGTATSSSTSVPTSVKSKGKKAKKNKK